MNNNGENLGPADNIQTTRVASYSAPGPANPLEPYILLMLLLSIGSFLYLSFAHLRRYLRSLRWMFGIMGSIFASPFQRNRKTMKGRVLLAVTDTPVPWVMISLCSNDTKKLSQCVSDRNGDFELPLVAGGKTVEAVRPGYEFTVAFTAKQEIEITATTELPQRATDQSFGESNGLRVSLLVLGASIALLLFLNRVTWPLGILVGLYCLYSLAEALPRMLGRVK
jgi:hypothetical protein